MHTVAVLFYSFGLTRLQVSIWNLTTMVHVFPCSWFDLCCPWFTLSSHWRCCKHIDFKIMQEHHMGLLMLRVMCSYYWE